MSGDRTSDFDFALPPERIAQEPLASRDESRLMIVRRDTGTIEHGGFRDLRDLIPAGDALVLNTTRVLRARLIGRRPSGGGAEVLLLRPLDDDRRWEALVHPGGKLHAGRRVTVADELSVEIEAVTDRRTRIVRLVSPLPPYDAIARFGHVPLPPYIRRPDLPTDAERYQTVYAREEGSVAAPTAGLHFTPALLDALVAKGVRPVHVLLHVGAGTFKPVEADDPAEHRMHEEWFRLDEAAATTLARTHAEGGQVWAVGTTTVRTLETVAAAGEGWRATSGETRIFIRPPYQWRAVDRLITNFHLPRSTLIMLVAAFAGYDLTMEAYRCAVRHGYRFYSYGDAMVVL